MTDHLSKSKLLAAMRKRLRYSCDISDLDVRRTVIIAECMEWIRQAERGDFDAEPAVAYRRMCELCGQMPFRCNWKYPVPGDACGGFVAKEPAANGEEIDKYFAEKPKPKTTKMQPKRYPCPYDPVIECDMRTGCAGCEEFDPCVQQSSKNLTQKDLCTAEMTQKSCENCADSESGFCVPGEKPYCWQPRDGK